jgi:hypothetical protein
MKRSLLASRLDDRRSYTSAQVGGSFHCWSPATPTPTLPFERETKQAGRGWCGAIRIRPMGRLWIWGDAVAAVRAHLYGSDASAGRQRTARFALLRNSRMSWSIAVSNLMPSSAHQLFSRLAHHVLTFALGRFLVLFKNTAEIYTLQKTTENSLVETNKFIY